MFKITNFDIQERVVKPIEDYLKNGIEPMWEEVRFTAIQSTKDSKSQRYFHEKMRQYYWIVLTDWTYRYQSSHFYDIMKTCMKKDDGLIEWLKEKNLVDYVDSWGDDFHGNALLYCLNKLIEKGFRPSEASWDTQSLEYKIARLRQVQTPQSGELYCILHAVLQIDSSNASTQERKEMMDKLCEHWDYLKHIYSLMTTSIVGCRLKNYLAIANNVKNLERCHPYIHIFYNIFIEKQELLLKSRDLKKAEKRLNDIEDIMRRTKQSDKLDDLCSILFGNELQNILKRKNLKSYDELENLVGQLKSTAKALEEKVKELEPLHKLCDNLKMALATSLPMSKLIEAIVSVHNAETSKIIFQEMDWTLDTNTVWSKYRTDIKKLIDRRISGEKDITNEIKQLIEHIAQSTQDTAAACKTAAENPSVNVQELVIQKTVQNEVKGVANGAIGINVNKSN